MLYLVCDTLTWEKASSAFTSIPIWRNVTVVLSRHTIRLTDCDFSKRSSDAACLSSSRTAGVIQSLIAITLDARSHTAAENMVNVILLSIQNDIS